MQLMNSEKSLGLGIGYGQNGSNSVTSKPYEYQLTTKNTALAGLDTPIADNLASSIEKLGKSEEPT